MAIGPFLHVLKRTDVPPDFLLQAVSFGRAPRCGLLSLGCMFGQHSQHLKCGTSRFLALCKSCGERDERYQNAVE